LDVGCAVGRFAFELGRTVEQVLGIDNSRAFIRAAQQMSRRHSLRFPLKESGTQFTPCTVHLPPVLQRSRVRFELGDALDLTKFPDEAFQVISAVNLIDRLPRPEQFLLAIPRLLAPGGQLILASPLTWMEEYTPCGEWLSNQQVLKLLQPYFQLERHGDLPFLIREHRRKYQLVVSEVWTFRRSKEL
jgi:SAM-dependent methyltransferase